MTASVASFRIRRDVMLRLAKNDACVIFLKMLAI